MKIFRIDPASMDKVDVAQLSDLVRQGTAIPLIAFDFATAARLSGLSRAWLYRDARLGKLRVLKAGARSLILYADLLSYMQNLPAAQFKPFAGENVAAQDVKSKTATEGEFVGNDDETVAKLGKTSTSLATRYTEASQQPAELPALITAAETTTTQPTK